MEDVGPTAEIQSKLKRSDGGGLASGMVDHREPYHQN